MKKIIRLTERDLTRIVKRVIREQFEDKNIETSGNRDWKSKLKSYESEMDNFLRQLKDSGTKIDKKRFLTQIRNETDQMYWVVYDNPDSKLSELDGFVEHQNDLMKRFIQKLNESDLARIVKRIIKESEINNDDPNTTYSDITFENPKKNKFCKLKVGKYIHASEDNPFYSPILICSDDILGEDVIKFVFGELRSRTPETVSEKVCKYLPQLSKKIENILNREETSPDDLNENTKMRNWEILDRSINCDSNLF